jgi:hypothetical protein
VCLIEGKREHKHGGGSAVGLLDEDDIAHARLIAAEPRLRTAIEHCFSGQRTWVVGKHSAGAEPKRCSRT